MRPSGWRPTPPARSRSSAIGRRRSRSRATTTRSCSSTISSPRPSSPYDVRLDGELVWPPDDGRPRRVVHTRNDEPRVRLVFGSCRVGDPQPTDLDAALARRREGARDRRALDVLEAAPARRARVARRGVAARRPGVRGRGVSGDGRVHQAQARHRRRAGRADRRLRGVHPALPRVVVGPGHPLAALDGADRR